MLIDINKVYATDININEDIFFEPEFYSKSIIKELDTIKVSGKITMNSLNEININLLIKGNMYLNDAVTLELVKIPLDITLDEVIDNNDEYFCIDNSKMDL